MGINLYATGNQEDFNYYVFDKTEEVHKKLRNLFSQIFNVNWSIMEEDVKSNEIKSVRIDISKNKDFHQTIGSIKEIHNNSKRETFVGGKNITGAINARDQRIDVFYGDKKMFIVIHCSKNFRIKFSEALLKIASLPEI